MLILTASLADVFKPCSCLKSPVQSAKCRRHREIASDKYGILKKVIWWNLILKLKFICIWNIFAIYLVQILCRVQFSSCAAEAGDHLWDKVGAGARPLPGGATYPLLTVLSNTPHYAMKTTVLLVSSSYFSNSWNCLKAGKCSPENTQKISYQARLFCNRQILW